jgi:hypothetical protein
VTDRAAFTVATLSIACLLAGLAVAYMPELRNLVGLVPRPGFRWPQRSNGDAGLPQGRSLPATSPTDSLGGQA